MIIQTSRSMRERFMASGTCLFLPLAAVPGDIQFNTVASWYGPGFQGKKTASGQLYDENKLTAANKSLPFGTKLVVKNRKNGRSCVVVINDRGPYVQGRGLDLSREAARRIGIQGTAPVYCCTFNPAKQPDSKPSDASVVESTDIASAKTAPEPLLIAGIQKMSARISTHPVNRHAASHAVARIALHKTAWAIASSSLPSAIHLTHARMNRERSQHSFQYIAFEGSHRTQHDGSRIASKFVRDYGA